MRHRKKGRKLGTDASHTRAMKKSLVAALLANDRIKTIEPRAKEIRGDVDRVITWAKRGDVHSRRLAIAKVGDKEIVREVFEKVEQGMFANRPGGYTRIYKLGNRKGDNAPMVIMELVTEPMKAKSAGTSDSDKPKASGAVAERKAAAEADAKLKFDEETAEAAEEAADDAIEESVEQAEEAVEETAEDAAAEASEAVEEVAEAAEAAEEVAEDVEAAAEDAAEAAADAADEASEAAESAEAVAEGAGEAAEAEEATEE